VAAHWAEISDRAGDFVPQSGSEHTAAVLQLVQQAMAG